MEDGTLVRFRTGKIVYKAYKAEPTSMTDWRARYTLVPVNGGRKRYRVLWEEFRVGWKDQVKPVNTSLGKIRRPRSFNKYAEYSGCTRRTYVGSRWVYKLAKYADDGNRKNRIEAAHYALQSGMSATVAIKKFGEDAVEASTSRYRDVPIAECHLLDDGVLMMERVRPINNLNLDEGGDQLSYEERESLGYRRPAWASNVDCEQIGYNRDNRLVAYDL